MSETTTAGQRVYRIRLDLGDGWKTPMPMDAFAALLNKAGRTTLYDSSKISRIEGGARKLSLEELPLFASVDPQRRGKLWLGWGETVDATQEPPKLKGGVVVGRLTTVVTPKRREKNPLQHEPE